MTFKPVVSWNYDGIEARAGASWLTFTHERRELLRARGSAEIDEFTDMVCNATFHIDSNDTTTITNAATGVSAPIDNNLMQDVARWASWINGLYWDDEQVDRARLENGRLTFETQKCILELTPDPEEAAKLANLLRAVCQSGYKPDEQRGKLVEFGNTDTITVAPAFGWHHTIAARSGSRLLTCYVPTSELAILMSQLHGVKPAAQTSDASIQGET